MPYLLASVLVVLAAAVRIDVPKVGAEAIGAEWTDLRTKLPRPDYE